MSEEREEKFTPGPWRISYGPSNIDVCYGKPKEEYSFPPSKTICACGIIGGKCGEGMNGANAALIAAAPEMYAALKNAIEYLAIFSDGTAREIGLRGLEILKKARGEE